jgi:hypothetical protein
VSLRQKGRVRYEGQLRLKRLVEHILLPIEASGDDLGSQVGAFEGEDLVALLLQFNATVSVEC